MRISKFRILFLFSFGVLTAFGFSAVANTSQTSNVATEKIIEGLGTIWSLEFLPDGRWLIGEKNGQVSLFDPVKNERTSVTGVPEVIDSGQAGFMDLAVHPEFKKNLFVYMTYVAKSGNAKTTHVARAKLDGKSFRDLKVLFRAEPALDTNQHFGSRIVFDGQGHIYFTIGERNERQNAQETSNHLGSVIRLNEDGSVPKDNPFVGRKGFRSEIWSYGHRNPQGIAIHPSTKEVWAIEHGPRGGDEINLIKKGANYGWPEITYGREYWGPKIGTTKKDGMEQPVKYFVPSIAPSSLLIYSGKKYKDWKGSFFSGALALTHLNRVEISGGRPVKEERYFENLGERVRDVVEDANGDIYFTTDSGRIYRLVR